MRHLSKVLIVFIVIVCSRIKVIAQAHQGNLFLKTDARAVLLQPKLSLEYFLKDKVSVEVGVGRGWSSEIFSQDRLGDKFGYTLLGIGPSKSVDVFSDIKYSFRQKNGRNNFYLGLGAMHRNSNVRNKFSYYELSEYHYQHYSLTESAELSLMRITIGTFTDTRFKRIGVNPYFALMIGSANLDYSIDTLGASSYDNYSPRVFPLQKAETRTVYLIEIGCKFYVDLSPIWRRDYDMKEN